MIRLLIDILSSPFVVEKLKPLTYRMLPLGVARRIEGLAWRIMSGGAPEDLESNTSAPWHYQRVLQAWQGGYDELAFTKALDSVGARFDSKLLGFLCRLTLETGNLNQAKEIADVIESSQFSELRKLSRDELAAALMICSRASRDCPVLLRLLANIEIDPRLSPALFDFSRRRVDADDSAWEPMESAYRKAGLKVIPAPSNEATSAATYFKELNNHFSDLKQSQRVLVSPPNRNVEVTVIVPSYNSSATLAEAIRSIQNQTLQGLEILVFDDNSTDGSYELAESIASSDFRVRVFRNSVNRGPYVARNRGLEIASGKFVTFHDADDWSHPEKLLSQVSFMTSNNLIASMSTRYRIDDSLNFRFSDDAKSLVGRNISSLMLDRSVVMASHIQFSEVQAAADSLFLRNLETIYGANAIGVVAALPPLSLQTTHPTSITQAGATKFIGRNFGFRHDFTVSSESDPSGMKLVKNGRLHKEWFYTSSVFEYREPLEAKSKMVLISDFSLPGGTCSAMINEIKFLIAAGAAFELIHLPPPWRTKEPLCVRLLDFMRENGLKFLPAGTVMHFELALVHPFSLVSPNVRVSDVSVESVLIPLHQVPENPRDHGLFYNPLDATRLARQHFKAEDVTWLPIGPKSRQLFSPWSSDETINCSQSDFPNLLITQGSPLQPCKDLTKSCIVGRHSRDSRDKWPDDEADIVKVYGELPGVTHRILGGVDSLLSQLNSRTASKLRRIWQISPFGSIDVDDFLREIDVFVYFTSEVNQETFGMAVVEALAFGVPVIAGEQYREEFGEAVITCSPNDFSQKLEELRRSSELRMSLISTGRRYVESKFGPDAGYEKYLKLGLNLR